MYMYIARICVIIIYLIISCIITFFLNPVTFPYLVNYMMVSDAHTCTTGSKGRRSVLESFSARREFLL